MEKKLSSLGIRLEKELHDKIQYIAAYEGRSMTRHIICLIQCCIYAFEHENGPITQADMDELKGSREKWKHFRWRQRRKSSKRP